MACGNRLTVIPLAGNCYITQKAPTADGGASVNTVSGLVNWTRTEAVASVYFKMQHPIQVFVAIRAKCVGGRSRLRISSPDTNQSYDVTISGDAFQDYGVGLFTLQKTGYSRVDLQGLAHSGFWIGDVSDLILEHPECGKVCYVCDPQQYTWGLRGPTINIFYEGYPPDADFYYNELTVPIGHDPVGAYFMAVGFDGGYFGMQTNSEERRTVLFAIWSNYQTDDPTQIPKDYDVQLIKSGRGAATEPFGNEGSGMHTNFDFSWKAGVTYKFLVHASPVDQNNTRYAAWFWAPELRWRLVASYRQPKASRFLNGFYSFDEGIDTATSYIERKVHLGNQFVRSPNGRWTEVTCARFLGADKESEERTDRTCGVEHGQFFLRSCGFFNETQEPATFCRPKLGKVPSLPIERLLAKAFDQK